MLLFALLCCVVVFFTFLLIDIPSLYDIFCGLALESTPFPKSPVSFIREGSIEAKIQELTVLLTTVTDFSPFQWLEKRNRCVTAD